MEDEGLISTKWIDGAQYLFSSQLRDIERFARWHYELSINIEGISAIDMLLSKMSAMETELYRLKKIIGYFRNEESFDFDNDLFN